MSLKSDLTTYVANIFKEKWTTRDGTVVPSPSDVKLNSNDAVKLKATILYADLVESTALVEDKTWSFAGEIYKTYLYCAAKIIKRHNGVIVSYDGDRIMAVFIGDRKNNDSVKAALEIKGVVVDIINPELKKVYKTESYEVKQVVGIDSGEVHAARTGVRDDSDLVWIGKAPNYAAKLCDLRTGNNSIIISSEVYSYLEDAQKIDGDKKNIWTSSTWSAKGVTIYKTHYYRSLPA